MTETQVQPKKQSRIGKRPVIVPKGVTVNITGSKVDVQGPKGKLTVTLHSDIVVKKEGDSVQVDANATGRNAARLQGLGRALIANMVKGAADGYEQTLDLVGTGYRSELKGKTLHFSLGLSHPVNIELPPQMTANIPPDSKGAVLMLACPDKALLGEFAAKIRSFRPPEPYGGKGIRYRDEKIRRKAGKAGKGKAK
ncbi:MAG: 50S ribosomal protein L6 [Myxococcales bacterium]|nr:50S ribosomal protein L6 [Myxococcales bacterium]